MKVPGLENWGSFCRSRRRGSVVPFYPLVAPIFFETKNLDLTCGGNYSSMWRGGRCFLLPFLNCTHFFQHKVLTWYIYLIHGGHFFSSKRGVCIFFGRNCLRVINAWVIIFLRGKRGVTLLLFFCLFVGPHFLSRACWLVLVRLLVEFYHIDVPCSFVRFSVCVCFFFW